MLFWEIIRVALGALLANKGRALLTMLGIIIGVGAVIAMMAMGAGASKAVQDRITSLGANLVFVSAQRHFEHGVAGNPAPLTSADAETLARRMTVATAIVPQLQRNFQVKYRSVNTNTNIVATVPDYFAVRRFNFANGRPFNNPEVTSRRRVAVIGADAAANLYGGPAMVGELVYINGSPYEVIGVLEPKGAEGFMNVDDQIVVPLTTGQYRLMGTDRLQGINVQLAAQSQMNDAAEQIERILRRQHKLRPDRDNDFNIRNQLDIMTTVAETSRTFTLLLAGIAAVSLVVGGIGIMNIMLVSVTERTREIGIRMAIGAQRTSILLQFLLESVVLCVIGGLIGVAAGIGTAKTIASTGSWAVIVTPQSIVLAVGFSLAVGLFFGIYPASRAARLDPIEALRYE